MVKHRKEYVKKLHNQAQAKPVRVTTETPRVVNAKAFNAKSAESAEESVECVAEYNGWNSQGDCFGVPRNDRAAGYSGWEMRAVWGMSGVLTLAILAICWR